MVRCVAIEVGGNFIFNAVLVDIGTMVPEQESFEEKFFNIFEVIGGGS